jgi:hypothetical protein
LNLLESLESSALGVWIRESEWGYPIVLICHTLGMACLVGVVTVFAMRLAFAKSATALDWFDTLFRIAWLGFAINLTSGLVLFSGSPQRFIANAAFQAKLAALALGAVLLWLLAQRVERDNRVSAAMAPRLATRCVAFGGLIVWFAAIAAGRLMAYIR